MMIEISELHKHLGTKDVLTDINFTVEPGRIFGLVGENGAGKTTLFKCATGVYCPEKGAVRIAGQTVYENPTVKEGIGYVADQNQYFPSYRIEELLSFYSLAYPRFSLERFWELNQIFDLPEKTRVKELSKGMQMRLTLMLSLSIRPDVLVLDEPTSGLDPLAKREVMNLLLEEVESRGVTVLISSHHLGDLERICDTIGIMAQGKMRSIHSLEEMKLSMRKLQAVFPQGEPADLASWPEVLAVEKMGRVHYIVTKQYSDDLLAKLHQTAPLVLEEVPLSLEDMFIYAAKEGYRQ
jgi:ABC-2 type transport system ATP-binding protein